MTQYQVSLNRERLTSAGITEISLRHREGTKRNVCQVALADAAHSPDFGLVVEFRCEYHWKGEHWSVLWTDEDVNDLLGEIASHR